MGIVDSTTGHSPKGERKVAGIIYIALSIAVVLGLLVALFMSRNKEFDTQKAASPEVTAPDAPAGAASPGTINQ
jgi:hypothetical protein